MKKLLYTLILLLAASITFASNNNVSSHDGVVINGIRWATHNVGTTPRTFAGSPERAGGLFSWEAALSACPCGWRLPTREELESLHNAQGKWTTLNGVNGHSFGSGDNTLFLPAGGWRAGNGAFDAGGTIGYYRSSTMATETDGWLLWFNRAGSTMTSGNRVRGFNVRCVALAH